MQRKKKSGRGVSAAPCAEVVRSSASPLQRFAFDVGWRSTVASRSAATPVRVAPAAGSGTGRGLGLIAALSAWPPPPASSRRGLSPWLPPSPLLLPVAGGGGVLRGGVRFGVWPALIRAAFAATCFAGPAGVAGPVGSLAYARRVVARGSFEPSRAALTQARPGASPEVRRSPTAFAGRAALPGAAGIRAIPLRRWGPSRHRARRYRVAAREEILCRLTFGGPSVGTGGGTGLRPCGFPPAPAGAVFRILVARGLPPAAIKDASSASVRVPARSGHAPPLRFLGGGVPLPGSSRRATWPVVAYGARTAPPRRPAALLGFRPSRRCSRPRVSRRLRRSDPPAVFPSRAPTWCVRFCSSGPVGHHFTQQVE